MKQAREDEFLKPGRIKSLISRLFRSTGADEPLPVPARSPQEREAKSSIFSGAHEDRGPEKPNHASPRENLKQLAARLKKENLALSTQLARLKAKAVQDGILSGREVELEEENSFLKRRIRELKEKQKVLVHQWKQLPAARETIETLRARNSFLTIKVDRQKEILASMAGQDSRGAKISLQLKKLADENRQLREQVIGQARVMEEMSEQFSSTEMADTFKGLLQANRTIETGIDTHPLDMDRISAENNTDAMLAAFDQLEDENLKLKEVLKSRERISSISLGSSSDPTDMELAVQSLHQENLRLQSAFAMKAEQCKAFGNLAPMSPRLLEKIRSHKAEKEKLLADLARKNRRIRELDELVANLHSRLDADGESSLEVQQLKVKLEQAENYLKTFKATELDYKKLKSEFGKLETRYKATHSQLQEMTLKAAKLTAAHDQLTKEYEKLFEII